MTNQESVNKVMVYGSLLSGLHNHGVISTGELLGTHTTKPEFTMYSLRGFPGVTHHGSTNIKGEVYEVDSNTFRDLDRLEGYPTFYTREVIDTPYGKAWIYLLNYPYNLSNEEVEDGDWRHYYSG
jgi:gamma-glutamylcyclotransferase (GGCT)/AIG2-like uncharacterized protein YtfP